MSTNKADYQRKAMETARIRNRLYVRQYKEGRPCTDCGIVYPWYVMEFDHTKDNKFRDVCVMVNRGHAIAKIQEEIDKCDLVCANCHRLRSGARGNW